jgi:hypothetical protein
MGGLRAALSDRLVDSGARLALDVLAVRRHAAAAGYRPTAGDEQVLFLLDLVSAAKIRLGVLLMPVDARTAARFR